MTSLALVKKTQSMSQYRASTFDVNRTLLQLILHKVFLTYLDVFLSFLTHMTALLVLTVAMGWLKTLLS